MLSQSQTPDPSQTPEWWLAIATLPRHEKSVLRYLDYAGYRTSLPLRRRARKRQCGTTWRSESPLIPGYVFVASGSDVKYRIVSAPGVIRIVGFGDTPGLIPSPEIEALERIAASPLPAAEAGYFQPGRLVRLIDGPLKGLEGSVVTEPQGTRFVVRVEMLQRSVAVEIDGTWAEPIGARF